MRLASAHYEATPLLADRRLRNPRCYSAPDYRPIGRRLPKRWCETIKARPAVERAYALAKTINETPSISDDEARKILGEGGQSEPGEQQSQQPAAALDHRSETSQLVRVPSDASTDCNDCAAMNAMASGVAPTQ